MLGLPATLIPLNEQRQVVCQAQGSLRVVLGLSRCSVLFTATERYVDPMLLYQDLRDLLYQDLRDLIDQDLRDLIDQDLRDLGVCDLEEIHIDQKSRIKNIPC